jgi:hypothetical protein
MLDVVSYLPSRRKTTQSGWVSFNAVCCTHNGESQDRRQRGGIKLDNQGWCYSCFNCGFSTGFRLGHALSIKARRFLSWLGVPPEEIDRVNLESMKYRSMEGLAQQRYRTPQATSVQFDEIDLPATLELVTEQSHPRAWSYVCDRAVPLDYPFMTERSDAATTTRPHVILPFTYHNSLVGYTYRFLDSRMPKYVSSLPKDYVFGVDLQKPNWQHVLVVEGVFDALSIGAVAVLHADISDGQAQLIRSIGRMVTVVPDQDQAGMRLVDQALELGWAVSMPEWHSGVKDVNDAVKRYGRLGALLTIMQARETSRIKIELRRKWLDKRIRT